MSNITILWVYGFVGSVITLLVAEMVSLIFFILPGYKKEVLTLKKAILHTKIDFRNRLDRLEYDHRNLRKYVLPPEQELILHKVGPRGRK